MTNMELRRENCDSCNHSMFCMIYWGKECRRQGGNRIPRMKSMMTPARRKADNKEQNRSVRPENQRTNTSEPIRTLVVNW